MTLFLWLLAILVFVGVVLILIENDPNYHDNGD